MKIFVRVRPNAREERVDKIGDILTVYVKEPPKENKANRRLINLLSEYFKVPKSQIFIVSGMKSKQKIIEIKQHKEGEHGTKK